jgi:hypothetical protein
LLATAGLHHPPSAGFLTHLPNEEKVERPAGQIERRCSSYNFMIYPCSPLLSTTAKKKSTHKHEPQQSVIYRFARNDESVGSEAENLVFANGELEF